MVRRVWSRVEVRERSLCLISVVPDVYWVCFGSRPFDMGYAGVGRE